MVQSILRRHEVERATGLPRSTIYDKMSKGEFPMPVHLSERAVGWLEHEIVEWQEARIAKRDDKVSGAMKDYNSRATYPKRETYSETSGPRCPRCTARAPNRLCKRCGPLPRIEMTSEGPRREVSR